MALKDQYGEQLFKTRAIGLMCEACAAAGTACSHKLSMNPEARRTRQQREGST